MSTIASTSTPAGISQRYRGYLELLHREASAAFDISEASRILNMDDDSVARLLGYLARRGWLSRVRRGLYVAVPLDARRSGEWVEDPWVVANRVFAPCYIGGWSACEHWGFTEQVFNTVLVVSGSKVRASGIEYPGMRFHVTTRGRELIFGTSGVWRGQTRVQVSDPSHTVIDVFDNPTIGGGLRHGADVLHEYLASEHRNDSLLVDYGDRVGNRTVFKRLGYLLETREAPTGLDVEPLIEACRERRSSGVTALDPSSAAQGQILRRWGLRINVDLTDSGSP